MLEWIYVARHGFRSNWVDPSIKTGPTGMPRDPPLAAYGTTQALRLASFLSSESALAPYPLPERVFSSPFYRCIETAVPTSEALRAGTGTGKGTGTVAGAGAGRGREAGNADDEEGNDAKKGGGLMLEHGVMEWYSPVKPSTGLHPRPADPSHLSLLFPDRIDEAYTSTLFPSRRGETLRDLQDRADLFVEAWTSRAEDMGLRTVVVFAHAASVIALGRALTGDKTLSVSAGCCSCSLYRRKRPPTRIFPGDIKPHGPAPGIAAVTGEAGEHSLRDLHTSRSTSSLAAASGLLALSSAKDAKDGGDGGDDDPPSRSSGTNLPSRGDKDTQTQGELRAGGNGDGTEMEVDGVLEAPEAPDAAEVSEHTPLVACGVAEWEPVWLGRADYLDNGVERDWSFRDAVLKDGEVIFDDGDHRPHPPEDTIPVGLAPGMERYLRRGRPGFNNGVPEVPVGLPTKGKM